MTEAATIAVDEKFFAEVCEQQRRVESARSIYKEAKNDAKEAKDALDQALETFETMFKRLASRTHGDAELPLFANQSDVVAAAEADPVVMGIVKRLLDRGQDVNAILVKGYNEAERHEIVSWLDTCDRIDEQNATGGDGDGYGLLPDPPAILAPPPLTAIDIADLANRIQDAEHLVDADQIQTWTPKQIAEARAWLNEAERVKAEKGEALTFDDLPAQPAFFTIDYSGDDIEKTAVGDGDALKSDEAHT